MIVKNEKDMSYVRHNFIQIRNKLLNKNSVAETHFQKLLTKSGLYFRREKASFRHNTRWSFFDFYLPYYHLFIEIDGNSHNTAEQKKIDAEKEETIKRKHKYLVRLTNEQVLTMESISIEFLLELCFEQSAAKRRRKGKEYSRNRYNAVMKHRRAQGVEDMMIDADFAIDENQEVWLYDHAIGEYFRFDNIMEAKFSLEMSVNEIHKLCEMSEYKRSATRRYVFAYTQYECESRVYMVYC